MFDARKVALMAMLGGLPEGALAQSEQRPRNPRPYRGAYREDLAKRQRKAQKRKG